MITDRELNEVSLSPTKKDYYQIWNELMDLAAKISNRWSPQSTNESDPGIVLLKALVAIADKLNYNIDKNTLEAFMPSATQQESMRKLTEMMGYTMKYYRAATCEVAISFIDSAEKTLESIGSIYFPKFVNLKNEEEDINYVTLEDFTLQYPEATRRISAIEGELIECESDNDNIISMIHLDDNNRYLLPEVNIAENAIFVCNIDDANGASRESEPWEQVDNLNIQLPGQKVFKFGFDSIEGLPYIQFPADISQLIQDGIRIKYIRTRGINGNISAKTLCKLEVPPLWGTADDDSPISSLSAEDFSVTNVSAARNGANPESLTEAYNNYKKIIGTFDTLVTCRDYMNKIYQMTVSETDTTPLVSNIIVSDIRDDINKAVTICSFNNYGICYSDRSLINRAETPEVNEIEHFDLILYPFKTLYGLNTKEEYMGTFIYNAENNNQIKYELEKNKTISHNFESPRSGEIACIKNYLRLKARITTVRKVTAAEEAEILNNVKTAIYKNFNSRYIDFGEEIPYDTILEVLETSDARIKDISLDEPSLYTSFLLADATGTEIELLASDNRTSTALTPGDTLYNKLALRNILAGRIAAFQYNENFTSGYDETPYPAAGNDPYEHDPEEHWTPVTYESTYPGKNKTITAMISEFMVKHENVPEEGLKLKENEAVQFRLPNFRTIKTYPSFVNYFVKLNDIKGATDAVPATFYSLGEFLDSTAVGGEYAVTLSDVTTDSYFNELLSCYKTLYVKVEQAETTQYVAVTTRQAEVTTYYADKPWWAIVGTDSSTTPGFKTISISNVTEFNAAVAKYGKVFTKQSSTYVIATGYRSSTTFYVFEVTSTTFIYVDKFLKTHNGWHGEKFDGLYRAIEANTERMPGKYVDAASIKYLKATVFITKVDPLLAFYVQHTHTTDDPDKQYTADGLGLDADYPGVGINSEYQLKTGEYLLINYTDSTTNAAGTETKTVINKYYGPNTIIKPNFALTDSILYHNSHSYPKKDGFYFVEVPKCEGMFTLGTNEQIEIRDLVEVKLDDDITYLYWERNDDDPKKEKNTFEFDEDPIVYTINGVQKTIYTAYTLKEGEHIYYTDAKKTDIAYYGQGTVVIRGTATPELEKYTSNGTVSEEDIMTYGLGATIPWVIIRGLDNKNATITLRENQYISLTEGDTLKYIDSHATTPDSFAMDLSNTWVNVASAKYKFAEGASEEDLPEISIVDKNGKAITWMVRSRLDFNLGPNKPQTLNDGDSITLLIKDANTGVVTRQKICPLQYKNGSEITEVKPISVYSNYLLQAAYDTIKLDTITLPKKFVIKLSQIEKPILEDGTQNVLNLGNYVNGESYFTKFSFDNLAVHSDSAAFTLNTNILDDRESQLDLEPFGLVMIYYIDENYVADHLNTNGTPKSGVHQPAHITAVGDTGATICRFNTNDTPSATYYLKPGIQVLKLTKQTKKLTFYPDYTKSSGTIVEESTCKSIVIFSELSLVKDINPKLDYRFDPNDSTNNTGLKQLLADIKDTGIASDFYYNVSVDNSNAIELNPNIATDLLSSPLTWYDPNNVNNKFVISEIDANYLNAGLVLTRSSKV